MDNIFELKARVALYEFRIQRLEKRAALKASQEALKEPQGELKKNEAEGIQREERDKLSKIVNTFFTRRCKRLESHAKFPWKVQSIWSLK